MGCEAEKVNSSSRPVVQRLLCDPSFFPAHQAEQPLCLGAEGSAAAASQEVTFSFHPVTRRWVWVGI